MHVFMSLNKCDRHPMTSYTNSSREMSQDRLTRWIRGSVRGPYTPQAGYTMSADKAPLLSSPPQRSRRQTGSYQLGPSRISFPPADTSALAKADDVGDDGEYEAETSTERSESRIGQRRSRGSHDAEMGRREGIPKLSRECLWA